MVEAGEGNGSMAPSTHSAYDLLGKGAGHAPIRLEVLPLPDGRELLTGFFRTEGGRGQLRPFRIVIHPRFHDPQLGVYLWQELNLQIRYALRHQTGEIDITVPQTMTGAG